ncbi:MAG: hypothetical protein U9R50_06980 [Campylobacterota bacterium]|nr:hypothetical protein [Campylobacterota bacterium]
MNELFSLNGSVFVLSTIVSVGPIRRFVNPTKHLSEELVKKYKVTPFAGLHYAARVDCGKYSEYLFGEKETDVEDLIVKLWQKVEEFQTFSSKAG